MSWGSQPNLCCLQEDEWQNVVLVCVQPSFCNNIKSVNISWYVLCEFPLKSMCCHFLACEKHRIYKSFLDSSRQAGTVWYFFQALWLILHLSESLVPCYHHVCCPGKNKIEDASDHTVHGLSLLLFPILFLLGTAVGDPAVDISIQGLILIFEWSD